MKRLNSVMGLGILAISMIIGCAPSMSSNSYTRGAARQVQTVEEGEVVYVREVMIEGTKTGFGTIAGGIMGRALGGGVGGGSGKKMAKAAGTFGGAVAGSVIEEKATQQKGLEITVKLESGEVIAIVQSADVVIEEGDLVRVLRRPNGEARVVQ